MVIRPERARYGDCLMVILAALPSAAAAPGDGSRCPDEPPAGLSAADWQGIRAAHVAARPASGTVGRGSFAGSEPIEQQAYLKASNTDAFDEFGSSVAISGDTVVIGAPFERSNATGVNGNQADNSAPGAGAAYVFVRNGATWTQQAYLKASNTDADDRFGRKVAISSDTILVGALGEDSNATGVNGNQANNDAGTSGAAFVFVRGGIVWTHQAYLKASNTDIFDQFGFSVAASVDPLVVGAPYEASRATGINGDQADNLGGTCGAVYVFVRGAGSFPVGDLNCDGFVTVGDIGGFVLALTNPAQYAVQFPGCEILNADINGDGFVTVGDIGPFVALLTGG